MAVITKENKTIRKAREEVSRVLDRYQVTLPEIMGVIKKGEVDEKIWESVKEHYEKTQEQLFAERYPSSWKNARKRR